ncbi:SDR family NAD(P)-dependent oxidoreductase [Saccharothrix longispora]|uniref:NAD(P)-dependent dehydrogenase (Short-subunit alcohol dehydrogenase family) n=1 Tax=Saccharothrix longispora TaxID=33920 RepID=A0ABU1PW42_9PSEU|nr:SDR family oxidoreductase [Saccharothrix longispora]MDR6594860.1 NAD(P)-dependent dehydrogenase (short-subunit alcohol dehydrogenase family) [Saccharothrix longispora]
MVVADVGAVAGAAVVDGIGGLFVRCDVCDPDDSRVEAAVADFGGLDIACLNAGVVTGGGDFDVERYRQVVTTNLDGVVYGVRAVLPALRARGGGSVVAMAGTAGLVPMPFDPVHGATKAAVVNCVRSPARLHAHEGIRINALCPGFAETPVIDGFRGVIQDLALPILDVSEVVAAFESVVASTGTGECWYVQSGWSSEPLLFAAPPDPRAPVVAS